LKKFCVAIYRTNSWERVSCHIALLKPYRTTYDFYFRVDEFLDQNRTANILLRNIGIKSHLIEPSYKMSPTNNAPFILSMQVSAHSMLIWASDIMSFYFMYSLIQPKFGRRRQTHHNIYELRIFKWAITYIHIHQKYEDPTLNIIRNFCCCSQAKYLSFVSP